MFINPVPIIAKTRERKNNAAVMMRDLRYLLDDAFFLLADKSYGYPCAKMVEFQHIIILKIFYVDIILISLKSLLQT